MSTQGKKSYGSKPYIGDGLSPEGFTKIDETFDVPPVGGKVGLIDFTNHDDTGNGYRDYLSEDVAEGNELQFRANEIPGNVSQNLVRAAFANKTTDNWQVRFANSGAIEQFPGLVTQLETGLTDQVNGKQYMSWTVKIVGGITRTIPA